MENRITFRIENELSEQLNAYCSDNKLSKTEAMNIAVQKLVADNGGGNGAGNAGGQANGAVVDEIFIRIDTLLSFVARYSPTTLPDIELENKISKLSAVARGDLKKIKGGE